MVLIHLVIQWKKSGVNFINILCTAFTFVDPKKIDNRIVFFTLLGSACVKAVSGMLMKLSPGVRYLDDVT